MKLADGRYLCARDAREAVSSDDEVREIAAGTDELDRLFSRFLSIPETNVVVTISDQFQLSSLFHHPLEGRLRQHLRRDQDQHPAGRQIHPSYLSVEPHRNRD